MFEYREKQLLSVNTVESIIVDTVECSGNYQNPEYNLIWKIVNDILKRIDATAKNNGVE